MNSETKEGEAHTNDNPSKEYLVEYNVPRHHVGSIIGYKGKNLQALQSEFNCKLHIEKEVAGSIYRKLVISGNDTKVIDAVKDKIVTLMSPTTTAATTNATESTNVLNISSTSDAENTESVTTTVPAIESTIGEESSDDEDNCDTKRVRNE